MDPAPRQGRRVTREHSQVGQGLVEYALILVLIVIVAIVSLAFLGTSVSGYLSTIGTSV